MVEPNELECCGNGCANCVLDLKNVQNMQALDLSGKINVLNKFRKYRLINKALHSPDVDNVWELHYKSLEPVNGEYILHLQPGYHLMMRRHWKRDEYIAALDKVKRRDALETERKYILRPYSPFWWDVCEMEFKILVNLKPEGPMISYLCQLEIGDETEFQGPIGAFTYTADQEGLQQLLIISHGVAVAPIIPIIEYILNNEEDSTRIMFLGCFENIQHIYFRNKLYEFNKYWNFKSCLFLAHELCTAQECHQAHENCLHFRAKLKYKENISPWRLDECQIKQIANNLKNCKNHVKVVLAGTGSFQKCFKKILIQLDYAEEQNIHLL